MIGWTLLAIYIVGIPVWIWAEKKFAPFEEGDYTIEFDGAHEVTPDIWKSRVCGRAALWPICIAVIIALFPIVLIDKMFELL